MLKGANLIVQEFYIVIHSRQANSKIVDEFGFLFFLNINALVIFGFATRVLINARPSNVESLIISFEEQSYIC